MIKYEDPLTRSIHTKENVRKLRHDIIIGVYPAGSRLIEAKLAEQLGSSRAPVRTALQMLAQEGLVINLANGGTEVVGCSVNYVSNMFDVRLLLERKALQSVMENAAFPYRPLFDVMEKFEQYRNGDVSSEITSMLDMMFHRSLMMMSENQPLLVAWNTMANIMQTILEITNMTNPTFEEFYEGHRKLADLIIQRKDECIDDLENHISVAKSIIVKRLGEVQTPTTSL